MNRSCDCSTQNNLLLLPSAKLIPVELQVDFGAIPSGMIPLGSLPALYYITKPYAQRNYRTLIAVHERAGMIDDFLCLHPELHAQTVAVGPTESLGHTITRALESVPVSPAHLVINFADTLLGEPIPARDIVCYRELQDLYRWTSFNLTPDRRIVDISDKEQIKRSPGPLPVFVGVFGVTQPAAILRLLREALTYPDREVDPFYKAIANYFNSLDVELKEFLSAADWRDFGHLDTYYRTQRRFFVNKRSFNELDVDVERGTVRKFSTAGDKLRHEIDWYTSLPATLRYLAPRIFDFGENTLGAFVEMEFYGYPALSDVYLHGDWNIGIWNQVLGSIGTALDRMQEHRAADIAPSHQRLAMSEMYESKTISRLAPIMADPRFALFNRPTLRINDRPCLGLPSCLEALPQVLNSLRIYDDCAFTIVHGDLCLSNILYDRRNGFVRLIDPRGIFGGIPMFGDPRYDLAKLTHSFEGHYDFLVNGMFELQVYDNAARLNIFRTAKHQALETIFHEWLIHRCNGSYLQIKLIESLLFLSMVPLHADRPRSQAAFLTRGLQLFQTVLDDAVAAARAASSAPCNELVC